MRLKLPDELITVLPSLLSETGWSLRITQLLAKLKGPLGSSGQMNPIAWKKQEWFFLSLLFLYKIRIYSCCSYLMPTIKFDLTKANAFKVISVIWFISNKQEWGKIFTRPRVDGAVLHTPLWLMNSIIDYVNRSYFPSRSSNHFPA